MPKQAQMGGGDNPLTTVTIRGGRWAASRFPPGKDTVPFVQETGWASGPLWTARKISSPTGIRFPDRPACTSPYPVYAIPAAIYNSTC